MFQARTWRTFLFLPLILLGSFGGAYGEEQLELELARGGRDEIVSVAASYLGVDHRWSGDDSVEGFDSSGFVRATLRANGHSFPRTIDLQLRSVTQIPKDELEPADLVFFSNSRGQAMQVGLYIGEGQFVHASSQAGRVVLSQLKDGFFEERFLSAGRLPNLGVGNEREAIASLNQHAPPSYLTTYTSTVESVGSTDEPQEGEPRVKSLFRRPTPYYYTTTSSRRSVFEPALPKEETWSEEETFRTWSLRLGEIISLGRQSVSGLVPF